MGQTDGRTDGRTDTRPLHRPCYAGSADQGDCRLDDWISYRDEREQRAVLEAVVLVGELGDLFQQILDELLPQQALFLRVQQLFLRERPISLGRRHLCACSDSEFDAS